MYNVVNRSIHSLIKLAIMLASCILVGFVMVVTAGEPVEPADVRSGTPPSFIVTAQDGLISVKATEASLRDVIERIGQELDIEIDTQIGHEDTVTADFRDLTLDAALKRLSGSYAYTTDTEGEKITKLFVFPKGKDASANRNAVSSRANDKHRAGSSEPFKFEFDPMKAMDKGQ